MFRHFILIFLVTAAITTTAVAQPNNLVKTELFDTIYRLDSALFVAFNGKKHEQVKQYFSSDLEFYHDKDGLSGYERNMNAFQSMFSKGGDLKRELIKESMEVYPVPNYGAVQIGRHRFCHTENGKPDCGTFRFIHIWKRTDEGWKITRIISVGH